MTGVAADRAYRSGPAPDAVWSEVETLPAAEARVLQDPRRREQVEYLWAASDFYRAKLGAAGVAPQDIQGVDDLARLPFTEKRELRESLASSPPLGRHLAAAVEHVIEGRGADYGVRAPRGPLRRHRGQPAEMEGRHPHERQLGQGGAVRAALQRVRPASRVLLRHAGVVISGDDLRDELILRLRHYEHKRLEVLPRRDPVIRG